MVDPPLYVFFWFAFKGTTCFHASLIGRIRWNNLCLGTSSLFLAAHMREVHGVSRCISMIYMNFQFTIQGGKKG